MIAVISPAKTLDYETPVKIKKHTQPQFADRSAELIDILGEYSPKRLAKLMSCLLYTSPSPRDLSTSRMPSSA